MSGDDELEPNHLNEEAAADAAPVAAEFVYKPRTAWRPGRCLGFIVNTTKPTARLRWPRGRGDKREFFARLKGRS
jgi:hypothetical protein